MNELISTYKRRVRFPNASASASAITVCLWRESRSCLHWHVQFHPTAFIMMPIKLSEYAVFCAHPERMDARIRIRVTSIKSRG